MSSTLQLQTDPKIENASMHIRYGEPPVVMENGDVDGDFDERKTNHEGYTAFMFVDHLPTYVLVRAKGYRDTLANDGQPIQMPHDELVTVSLTLAPIELSRLVSIDRGRHRMIDELGDAVYGRGAGFFLGHKLHLDGRDYSPQLRQLRDLGCNLVREMGSFESLGGFNPKDYGDSYYNQLPSHLKILEREGIYSLWTATAAIGGMMNPDEVMRHLARTKEVLTDCPNVIFSPVNEQGQHNNSIDRERFYRELCPGGKFAWMLFDTGSFGMDEPCQPPFGTHAVLHTRRVSRAQQIKDCNIVDHPNYLNDGLEVGLDEPYRLGDDGSGADHIDPQVAQDAAGSAYTALFWVAHSLQGEKAELLTGNTYDCVARAMTAMRGF